MMQRKRNRTRKIRRRRQKKAHVSCVRLGLSVVGSRWDRAEKELKVTCRSFEVRCHVSGIALHRFFKQIGERGFELKSIK